jgi:hypothetical protein
MASFHLPPQLAITDLRQRSFASLRYIILQQHLQTPIDSARQPSLPASRARHFAIFHMTFYLLLSAGYTSSDLSGYIGDFSVAKGLAEGANHRRW